MEKTKKEGKGKQKWYIAVRDWLSGVLKMVHRR